MENNRPFAISAGILTAAIVLVLLIGMRGTPEVVEKRLNQLPYQIGQWRGRDIPMEQRIVDELDTDIYINRTYSSKVSDPGVIRLYIGYYGTEKGGRTGHNPYACLPSQGWAIVEKKKILIKVSLDGQKEKVVSLNRLLVRSNETNNFIYHWYQSDGDTVLSSGIEQNIDRFWKRIIFNRNDGAFIQVTSVSNNDMKTTA
jgi:EpsI family protein